MKPGLPGLRRWPAVLLGAAIAVTTLPADAMTVVTSGASAPPRTSAKPPPAARNARHVPSLDLVSGTIGGIDLAKKLIVISGVPLTWNTARLHVFHRGQRGSEHDLRAGQAVRFAVEPGVSGSRNVVLVYVEGS